MLKGAEKSDDCGEITRGVAQITASLKGKTLQDIFDADCLREEKAGRQFALYLLHFFLNGINQGKLKCSPEDILKNNVVVRAEPEFHFLLTNSKVDEDKNLIDDLQNMARLFFLAYIGGGHDRSVFREAFNLRDVDLLREKTEGTDLEEDNWMELCELLEELFDARQWREEKQEEMIQKMERKVHSLFLQDEDLPSLKVQLRSWIFPELLEKPVGPSAGDISSKTVPYAQPGEPSSCFDKMFCSKSKEPLGKGGFGTVFKVKHSVDEKDYAVKRMIVRQKDLKNVKKEVLFLEQLQHPNIVRYITSWVEDANSEDTNVSEGSSEQLSSKGENNSLSEGSSEQLSSKGENNSLSEGSSKQLSSKGKTNREDTDTKSSDSVQFAASDGDGQDSYNGAQGDDEEANSDSVQFAASDGDGQVGYNGAQGDDEEANSDSNKVILYIQMELCVCTLRTWLDGRERSRIHDSVNRRIFHQLLEGVKFIHSKGVIHRDLKPCNIFLTSFDNPHVKIGDFGLGKLGSAESTSPSASVEGVAERHTVERGTQTYTSPEQWKGLSCDSKNDIYSLGVVLFEMYHNFATGMERGTLLHQLRQSNVCDSAFRDSWPDQAEMVVACTCHEARARPSADDLLRSELFSSADQNPAEKLTELADEIDRLKKDKESLMERLKDLQGKDRMQQLEEEVQTLKEGQTRLMEQVEARDQMIKKLTEERKELLAEIRALKKLGD